MFQEFEKATGIKVNFIRFSSGEALARVIAEKNNPRIDVVTPEAALIPALIVVGLLFVGGVYFLGMLKFGPKAIWNEPGDTKALER